MSNLNQINLQEDSEKIYNHIRKRIEEYDPFRNIGPGNQGDLITQISLGFQFDQAGWITLVFDTRSNAEPDGEWTSSLYLKENLFELSSWFTAINDLIETDNPIKFIMPDGSINITNTDTDMKEIAAYFGNMLRDILIRIRDEGRFCKLPLGNRCIMNVEEICGEYGWPVYENRVSEGEIIC